MSLLEYLRKDLKLSAKTVVSGFPRYISFAVVILFVSMLFSTVSILNYNHQKTQRAYLESRYLSNNGDVYHFQLLNLTHDQYNILRQFDVEQTDLDEVFKIVGGIESNISGTQEKRFDVDIQLIGDIDESFEAFAGRYTEALSEESQDYTLLKTPLLDYELSVAKNTVIFILMLALVVAAGACALWILHSTMINHYKFTYGIYMTYGATFGRLFLTAFWEQFWIVLVTWIPSSLVSLLIGWLVFKGTGLAFSIYWMAFVWAFLLTLLTVSIAVFVSIRSASAKTPSALIAAADNSNYIHSPRVSNDLIGGTFPGTLGKITYRRYWRYILRLMAGALAFSMLYVAASTVAYCYDRVLTLDKPEITVDFEIPDFYQEDGESVKDYSQYGYNEEKSDLISSLPGIKTIMKRAYYQAMSVGSHVKISSKIPKLFAGGVTVKGSAGNGDSRAYLNVDYNALDEEVIASFDSLGYEVEGSLESVLDGEKTIAVTEGFLGSSKFDWKIGDVVMVADLPEEDIHDRLNAIALGLMTADQDKLLGAWLREEVFSYTEYTVGAIISEIPTDQNWGIYFSEKDYKAVTGYSATYNGLEIYAESDASEEDISFIYRELRDAADYYTNMTVTDLDAQTHETLELNKNYASIISMIAFVLLTVSPLIWFFSQSLFYQKRRPELELLQAIGASNDSIKRYLIGDGIRFAVTGGLIFALLAPFVSWIVHRLVGYIMIFAGGTMLASFHLPIAAYIIGILLNVICGFASVYTAWLSYKRNRSAVYSDMPDIGISNQANESKEASV